MGAPRIVSPTYSTNPSAIKQRRYIKNHPKKWRKIHYKSNKKWAKNNREVYLKCKRDDYRKKTAEVWEFFGNKCVKCGFNDPDCFELDHINGEGHTEKNSRGSKKYATMDAKYKLVKTNPVLAKTKFQLLCANCNKKKQRQLHEYWNGK